MVQRPGGKRGGGQSPSSGASKVLKEVPVDFHFSLGQMLGPLVGGAPFKMD